MEVQALGSQGLLLQGAAQGRHPLSLLVAVHEQQRLIQQALGSEQYIRGLPGYLEPHPKQSHSPYLLPLLWLEATGWLAGC